jgi:hypothetical protein
MKRILFFFLAVLVFSSCNKSEKTDYLIFGKFYGFCVGDDCIKMYKVTSKNLYKETSPEYPSNEEYNGKFNTKINDKLSVAKPLLNMIPEKLKEEEAFIGCPDCADQGGIYVEYKADGETYFFRIDNFRDNVPEYLHDFLDEIDSVVEDLK